MVSLKIRRITSHPAFTAEVLTAKKSDRAVCTELKRDGTITEMHKNLWRRVKINLLNNEGKRGG